MNQKKTFKSGKVIVLQLASFAVAAELRKVGFRELKDVDFSELVKLAGGKKMSELSSEDLPITALQGVVCQLLSSTAFEDAVFECMKCCQYDGERITRDSFEAEDAREDYLPCAWEVILLNLSPFFKGLDLKSFLPSGTPKVESPR